MKRVRSLLRVSSKQQLHDDDIPIQRAEIYNYIKNQPDWVLEHEYIEKAVSAFKNTVQEREVLLQILEDAKQKKFDILLTFMSDRIGRKEEYSMYIATLNNLGIKVWTIKEGLLSTSEDTDRLTLFIKFWSNERESRKTGQRVKAAQSEMVKHGRYVGGKAPYGYELVYNGEISNHGRALKKLQIKESEAKIIREIYRLSVEENFGSYSIAKRLNKQGILSNGKEWKSCTVSDRLKNPIYCGYITYNRRTHTKTYKTNPREEWIYSEKPVEELQIVSQSIWFKAQELREKRNDSFNATKDVYSITSSGSLPLMGLVYCGSCGTRLTNGSRYDRWNLKSGEIVKKMSRRYKCTNRANASLQCKGSALYKADEIEALIFTEVNKYVKNLKKSNVYIEIQKKQEQAQKSILREIDSLRKEIETIQSDIKALESSIPQAIQGKGMFSAERLSTLLQEKETEKERIKQILNQKQQEYNSTNLSNKDIAKFSSIIPNWEQEFTNAPMHQKKILLSKIIERIEVNKEEIRIIFKISENTYPKGEETMKTQENPGEKVQTKTDTKPTTR